MFKSVKSVWKRIKAAWRAFRHPDTPIQTVEVLVPVGDSRFGRTQRPQRFTIVRQRPDGTDQVIYPEKLGQDRGGEALRYYERAEPELVGETISFRDGEHVRSRKVGLA